MPKRISKKPRDANQTASAVVALATAEIMDDKIAISQIMAEMGRKGGKIGGKRSMDTMTPSERKKRAKRAAKARWAKPKRG
jgi:hypothetical protein